MDRKRATELLIALMRRTADCQCGNFDISREDAQAIQFFIDESGEIVNYNPDQLMLPLKGNELAKRK
jgi:hypothetical protein